jgi:hypothetical protein
MMYLDGLRASREKGLTVATQGKGLLRLSSHRGTTDVEMLQDIDIVFGEAPRAHKAGGIVS